MIVNGNHISLQELEKPTIEELIKKFNIKNSMIAVEINGKIISKSEWKKQILKENDKIEIIRFVGGG